MKPLLVGEANPYQVHPHLSQYFALYPHPPRCAGWNLCHRIMGLSENEYLARFERVNLCDGEWSMKKAKAQATFLFNNGRGRLHVLCGSKVCKAFNVPFEPFTRVNDLDRIYVILPHLSGLSRAWNEPGAYERARAALREAGVL